MKKTLLVLIFCLAVLPLCLHANDRYRIPDRTFEIGLMNVRAGFSNNFLSFSDFFKESAVINIDDLDKGFKMNLEFALTPFYFSYNRNGEWGFGFSTGLDAVGIINLSGDMITLNEAKKEKSDVGFALFADAQLSTFFHVSDFKIKISPSVYYPILYADSNISYTYSAAGKELNIDYEMYVYSAWSMELMEENEEFKFNAKPGVDVSLGVEYPLAEAIGLKDRFRLLDFKVGADFINVPILPSQLRYYSVVTGHIGGEESLDIFSEDMDFDNFTSNEDPVYGEGEKNILRPFTFHAWADWSPFGKMPVSFIPVLGFQINPLYNDPFSFEVGLKSRLDILNMFITTFGVGYHDRTWKNSIDFAFNLRFFEFNIGLDMRSPDFLESWKGKGFGFNFGLKFGW